MQKYKNMPKLFIVMGLPAIGKSTYIKEHIDESCQVWIPIINRKNSKIQNFNLFLRLIESGLSDGYDVYAESVCATKADRKKILDRLNKNLFGELNIIWIKDDITAALSHNKSRLLTEEYVAPAAIYQINDRFSEPEYSEGFNNIYIVDHYGNMTRKDN